MQATTRTASSLSPTPPEKRAKTEAHSIFIPADVLAIIFSNLPPKEILRNSRVCRRWKGILDNKTTLKGIIPKISSFVFGVRFSCKQIVDLVNRWSNGLPKLDLAFVKFITKSQINRLEPKIQNLRVRNCSIDNESLDILFSKMEKKDATLKIVLKRNRSITFEAVFDSLRKHQVQLKKLTIDFDGNNKQDSVISEAFVNFVNAGGFRQQSCQLSLHALWSNPQILTCFSQNHIQFSKLKLKLKLNIFYSRVDNFIHQYHETLAACIRNDLLTQECDFRQVIRNDDGSNKVIDALLEKGIRVKHFNGMSRSQSLTQQHEMDSQQRIAFFDTCRGLAPLCALSFMPADLIESAPQIIASPVFIRKLLIAGDTNNDRSQFSQQMCALIERAKWVEAYALMLNEDLWDDSVLSTLSRSPHRIGHFELFCRGSSAYNPCGTRLKLTTTQFELFLLSISQRQKSIRTFILNPYYDANVIFTQSVFDTLTKMGEQKFKFHEFQLINSLIYYPEKKETRLNLLPFVQSQALSECVSLTLNLDIENWTETLRALTDSQLRILHIAIRARHLNEISNFFSTYRFKHLIKLKVESRAWFLDRSEFVPRTIWRFYFERSQT